MIRWIQNLNERTVLIVLVLVAIVSLGVSALSHWLNGEVAWWSWADGAFQNFSTEMMGAIVTFALFELVIGVRNEKKNLLLQLRSKDNATALNALEQIREKGWHKDGSLIGANLAGANLTGANLERANLADANLNYANLEGADLQGVNLQNAILHHANLKGAYALAINLQNASLSGAELQKAILWRVNLQGTNLRAVTLQDASLLGAKLQGANLSDANLQNCELSETEFDLSSILPDAKGIGSIEKNLYDKNWSPQTDMNRYTDPSHRDFWQPDWVKAGGKGGYFPLPKS